MPELRLDISDELMAVIDGVAQASGKSRKEVVTEVMTPWAQQKILEAKIICRIAGINPFAPEDKG